MHDHITGNATFTRIIEVIVAPNGETKVETKGFQGAGCRIASEFLETALGVRTDETRTSEFFQTTAVEQTICQGGSA